MTDLKPLSQDGASERQTTSGSRARSAAGWQFQRRRNSTLSVCDFNDRLVVNKTYHAEYSARQEHEAYSRLAPLFEETSGMRLPDICELDDSTNAILIEYIEGKDLRDLIKSDGFRSLAPHEERLVSLFAKARRRMERFDSDPANFIVSDATGELVLVDPVCQEIELPDYVLVVFLFGLVKAALANPFRRDILRLRDVVATFRDAYCAQCDQADPQSVRDQLADYIGVVIQWNREPASSESLALKAMRHCFWIPVLRGGRLWLRWRSRHG